MIPIILVAEQLTNNPIYSPNTPVRWEVWGTEAFSKFTQEVCGWFRNGAKLMEPWVQWFKAWGHLNCAMECLLECCAMQWGSTDGLYCPTWQVSSATWTLLIKCRKSVLYLHAPQKESFNMITLHLLMQLQLCIILLGTTNCVIALKPMSLDIALKPLGKCGHYSVIFISE